jgi:hypothetical protein
VIQNEVLILWQDVSWCQTLASLLPKYFKMQSPFVAMVSVEMSKIPLLNIASLLSK